MSDLFKTCSYATMYGTAAEVPDDIIAHNAYAALNVLTHLEQFPRANIDALSADYEFLSEECAVRGLEEHSAVKADGSFCTCRDR